MFCSSSAVHQGCFPGSRCHSSPKAGSPPLTLVRQGRTHFPHQQARGDKEGAGTATGTMEDSNNSKHRELGLMSRGHG